MNHVAIIRDGKIVSFHNSHNEAFVEIHRIQPQSFDWAKKYEGYDIVECDKVHKTKEEIFECKFCNALLDSVPKHKHEICTECRMPCHSHKKSCSYPPCGQ